MSNIKFEYTPTSWATSTSITPERLNKIENAFVQLSTVVNAITVELDQLKAALNGVRQNLGTWQNDMQFEIKHLADQTLLLASEDMIQAARDTMAELSNNAQSVVDDVRLNVTTHFDNYVGPMINSMNNQIIAMEDANRNTEETIASFRDWKNDKDTELSDLRSWRTTKDADDVRRDDEVANIRNTALTSAAAKDVLRTIASEEGYTTASNFTARAEQAGFAKTADVDTIITSKGYQTATDVETKVTAGTKDLIKLSDITSDKISQLGFAKTTDVETKIGLEAAARENAITAEATARASAITNATSGLIRGENFNTLLSAAATGLGFAKTADVEDKIRLETEARETALTNAEERLEKATNRKLGTAFGMDIKDGEDVQPAALQTQLQGFASASLLNAGVFNRLKDDGTTESWSLLTDMANIKTAVAQLATALETLETRIDTLHGSTDEGDGGFNIGFADSVSDLVRPGTQINPGFLGGLNSPSKKDD